MNEKPDKVVILRWQRKVLKKNPLMWMAPRYNNTYRTGQEIEPNNPDTADNLTPNQMTGVEKLTAEQMKKFPLVINPENYYFYPDGRKFDLNKKEDKIMLDFLLLSFQRIARTYATYDRVLHDGYIEDHEAESKSVVDKTELLYDALTLIKQRQIEEVMEAALYTNHVYQESEIDVMKMSKNQVYSELYKIAKDNPTVILDAFSEKAAKDIFVLKLEMHNIIKRREGSFYEGARFLGNSVQEVSEYFQRNDKIADIERVKKILMQKENKTYGGEEMMEYDDIITKIESALFKKDLIKGHDLITKGIKFFPGDKTIIDLRVALEALKTGAVDEKKNELKQELNDMTIDELHVKCNQLKNRGIKKVDYEDKTREEIIQLILSKF